MPPETLADSVRSAPVLRRLPNEDLGRLLECGSVVRFSSGERLLDEGQAAESVFLVLEGRVAVVKRAGEGVAARKIAARGRGDWLGETGALEGAASSASVLSETATRVLRIPADRFREVVSSSPEALLDLLRSANVRLGESDEGLIRSLSREVRALRSENRELTRENRQLQRALDWRTGFDGFIGGGASARAVRDAGRQAARNDLPVVIVGETGTGKELIARAIHQTGARASRPFVALNCALVTGTLLESELFGHARGAFTGASQAKPGLVEEADGGTLLLDEAADMPAALQAALLRFLELGEFRRLGETRVRHADVRVIAATQVPLFEAVEAGRFRLDLLYRIGVMEIRIPPLRERPEDLPQLAAHYVERVAARLGVRPLRLSEEVLESLTRYEFPGNVRELENEIDRLYAVLTAGSRVPVESLSERILGGAEISSDCYSEAVRQFKVRLVERVLRDSGWNRTRAAQRLGVHRSNLFRLMRDLGIPAPPPEGRAKDRI